MHKVNDKFLVKLLLRCISIPTRHINELRSIRDDLAHKFGCMTLVAIESVSEANIQLE